MISKSLSTSERFASLHDHAGKLAEFCQSLYPLLVAHSDDWGCQHGDIFTIKHLVHPTSPRRLAEFEAAMMHLHNAGLVTWWEEDGKHYVYIRGHYGHQQLKGHDQDGRKRAIPEPPENPSNFDVSAQIRPNPPKCALREEKRREEKGREAIRSPKTLATAEAGEEAETEDKNQNALVGSFIKAFCDLYSKHRNGARYLVVRHRDIPIVRKLLGTYPQERLLQMAHALLIARDDWIADTDRGISILSTKATWLDDRLSEWEAQQGRKIQA